MKPEPSDEGTPQKVYNCLALTAEIIFLILKLIYYIAEDIYLRIFPKEQENVRGKVVLITGAAHGIGKETALIYAKLGATVVCWDINEKGNAELLKEISALGGKAYAYVCNVTKRDEIMEVAAKTKKEVGIVDILINNAGIMPTHPLTQQTESEIRLVYDINVLAHFYIIQAFIPDMIKQKKGHIVALSSCAGLYGLRNLVPYCGTKFAVKGIMVALSEEMRYYEPDADIKFTTIFPYMVDTGLCKKPRARFNKLIRLVKPKDAGAAIVKAQRLGIVEESIPKIWLALQKTLDVLPNKAYQMFLDLFDSGVDSDLS